VTATRGTDPPPAGPPWLGGGGGGGWSRSPPPRATGGPAGRAGRVPRVAGHTGRLVLGEVQRAELRGGGLADRHGAGGAHAGDVHGVDGDGRAPRPRHAPVPRRHPGAVLQVLDAEGDPGEGARVVARRHGGVDRLGGGTGDVRTDVHERVERAVPRLDGGQAGVEHVDGAAPAGPHVVGDGGGGEAPEVGPFASVMGASSPTPQPYARRGDRRARPTCVWRLTLSSSSPSTTASGEPTTPTSTARRSGCATTGPVAPPSSGACTPSPGTSGPAVATIEVFPAVALALATARCRCGPPQGPVGGASRRSRLR
jgi:hypothetical protein